MSALASALKCYTCNERILNVDTCVTKGEEDCSTKQLTDAVCMQSLTTFSTSALRIARLHMKHTYSVDQASWVQAQCADRSLFNDVMIDKCVTYSVSDTGTTSSTGVNRS